MIDGQGDARRRALRAITAGLVALALGLPALVAAKEEARKQPRAEMAQVFEAITHLLPLSLSEQKWSDPKNRKEILEWLDLLASRSKALEAHAEGRDAGFRNLSRSLSADVEEIRERYRAGRYEESHYFMVESTKNCVACHSRLPTAREFPLADQLISQVDFEALSVHEKTQLLVATRRFARAMDVWEKAFVEPEITPEMLDLGGYLLDYLTIGLRVERAPGRVRATLVKLRARKDMPRYLRRHIDGWIRALDATRGDLDRKDRLERARELVFVKGNVDPYPLGRDRFVYDLVASSLLLQFLDGSEVVSDAKTAEAYYLLGVVESRSVDSYWVPQADFHLEASIRMAPDSPFAEDAYAILEENLVVGYGGVSGADLPADVWATLSELRRIIDESAPTAEGEVGR